MEIMEQHTLPRQCMEHNTLNLSNEVAASEWLWSSTEHIFFRLGIPVILLIGTLGNLAFIVVVFRVKAMQTITNAYLANIAFADLTFVLYTCTIYFITYTQTPVRNDVLFLRGIGCAGAFGLSYFGYFASLLLLTVVAAERYYAICRPFQHMVIMGKKHTIRMIASCWLTGVVLVALVMPRYGKVDEHCIIWPEDEEFDSFPSVIQFCVTLHHDVFVLGEVALTGPFCLLMPVHMYMYGSIILALSNRPGVTASEEAQAASSQQNDSAARARNQVARLLIINGTVFFLCQAPYRIVSVHLILEHLTGTGFLGPVHYGIAILMSRCLILLNSCANPFIYLATSSFYRQAFRAGFTCQQMQRNKGVSVRLSSTQTVVQ